MSSNLEVANSIPNAIDVIDGRMSECKIVLVDDNPVGTKLLSRLLSKAGYRRIFTTNDPTQVEAMIGEVQPDLVVLDLHMPAPDGYSLLKLIRDANAQGPFLPILVLTADNVQESRWKALRLGASDFLTKPFDALEISLRVRNFLQMRLLAKDLAEQNFALEQRVIERSQRSVRAYSEMVERLASIGDFRDENTGEHCRRVAELSYGIAIRLGLTEDQAENIRMASPLHDIGKIGVAEEIIQKPARLTDQEYEAVKAHTTIGASLLEGSESELLQLAYLIAASHHERWDGTGYPQGLNGESIPLAARIVSVADVFDALTSARPYKEAWTPYKALNEIQAHSGTHFDPAVVDALTYVLHDEIQVAA